MNQPHSVRSLLPRDDRLALMTDLYELTMAAGYDCGELRDCRATFELFIRHLPHQRNYLVAAGLEQALHYLLTLRFHDDDIAYLRGRPEFEHVPREWFDRLRDFRFTGDVWAVPEGTVVFAEEPILQVTARATEAQIVETYLLTSIAFQTTVASKAARVVDAAAGGTAVRSDRLQAVGGAAEAGRCERAAGPAEAGHYERAVVDFGSRRAHGPQAGVLAARAAYIGGCVGTSNVWAARALGIRPFGTMAHSWVMAWWDERRAFAEYARLFPGNCTLLIDTYDTVQGARRAVESGAKPQAVRLDSGDLVELAKQVRRVLDEGGLRETKIFASGDLNEYKIRHLLAAGAPIDAFGVGTELVTSFDAPAVGAVYKLVAFQEHDVRAPSPPSGGRGQGEGGGPAAAHPPPTPPPQAAERHMAGRIKLSPGKKSYPHLKQVFRQTGPDGRFTADVIGRYDEDLPGEPLLEQVVDRGRLLRELPSLDESRRRCREQLERLPTALRSLDAAADYPVRFSDRLERDADAIRRRRGAQ